MPGTPMAKSRFLVLGELLHLLRRHDLLGQLLEVFRLAAAA